MKQQTDHSMYEFQTVIHSFQTWKKLTNWNENEMNISRKEITYWKKQRHRNLCLERQRFLCKFIHNMEFRDYLQRRVSALESFPTNPYLPLSGLYLYYFSSEITPQNKPKNCFQSQSCVNSLESGTIAMIYKYEQTLWSKWVHLAWVTAWHARLLLWILSMTPFCLLSGESPFHGFWTF